MPTNPTQAERIERLKKRVVFPCVVAELSLGDEIRAALSRIEELEGALKLLDAHLENHGFAPDGPMRMIAVHPELCDRFKLKEPLDAALNAAKEGE